MARKPQGESMGLPYNVSKPEPDEVGKGVWDNDDDRVIRPKNVGWGYGLNFSALVRRLFGRSAR